jgi:hypothetical protein
MSAARAAPGGWKKDRTVVTARRAAKLRKATDNIVNFPSPANRSMIARCWSLDVRLIPGTPSRPGRRHGGRGRTRSLPISMDPLLGSRDVIGRERVLFPDFRQIRRSVPGHGDFRDRAAGPRPLQASNAFRASSRRPGASCATQCPTPSKLHRLAAGSRVMARDAISL